MEVSGQLHAPPGLLRGSSPRDPLDKSLGGPQSRYEHYREKKNLLPLSGIEPLFLGLVRSLVAIMAELSQLLMYTQGNHKIPF
jgi:hypothetical protein